MAIDPVCGREVTEDARHRAVQGNETFYFCGPRCRAKFEEGALRREGAPEAHPRRRGPGLTAYTCPMHPQVVRPGPGNCPICGMALEPREPAAAEEDREPADMTRRFWASVALSLPVLALAMGAHVPGIRQGIAGIASARALTWAQLVLATPVVLWGGWPFFVRFGLSLGNRSLNMFTLIGLGVGSPMHTA